jgi:hypothetical protein
MPTPIKGAVLRGRLPMCLLVAALVSHSVCAQPPVSRPPVAEQPSAEVVNQYRRLALEKHLRDGSTGSARGVTGSVAVTARCVAGFIVNTSHRVSAQDVRIVAAEHSECDAGRCRSYQVTAARNSRRPFDLEVSVTCA